MTFFMYSILRYIFAKMDLFNIVSKLLPGHKEKTTTLACISEQFFYCIWSECLFPWLMSHFLPVVGKKPLVCRPRHCAAKQPSHVL
jgi:hypothetical protein